MVWPDFFRLAAYRIRSGSWVWDPSGYHLQALRPGGQGGTAKISTQRLFFGVFFWGGSSQVMFIYLFISFFFFFWGGGGIFPHICFMFLRDFWNKHIWDTEGSTCRPSDPMLVDRQVLGSYEVGWPNKASICWNLSWVTLWHLAVLQVWKERWSQGWRLMFWYIDIFVVIHF